MKGKLLFLVFSFLFGMNAALAAPEDNKGGHDDHEEHGEARTLIAPDMVQQAGITTAVAGPGILEQTITVYGRVTTLPENVSHLRARFPGIIDEVRVSIGDHVKAGDVLATIESDESLKAYQLRSPITGIVTERYANIGESTLDNVLFTISNLTVLWAELKVFPTQRPQVSPGDKVVVSVDDLTQETSLRHLVPGSEGQPFVIARAEIDNSKGRWTPGLLVKGNIRTATIDVPLVVAEQALQSVEGETVVFVVEGDEFIARPVETGRHDKQHTEILSGLKAGDTYVVNNSYLIKADIEKSGAEHSH